MSFVGARETPLRRLTVWFPRAIFALVLFASGLVSNRVTAAPGDDRTMTLIMSDIGFNAEIVGLLKAEMERQGFHLSWVVINDIIQPNKLVNDHQADANSFQHEPYYDQFVMDHQLSNTVRAFYTQFTPSGLYSRKYKSLQDLPEGATIGIPIDPANNGRALFLLQDHGLLKMRPGVSVTHATVRDVIENPRRLQFREVDQLMLMRTIDNVDVGFLFAGYAVLSGFEPVKSALAIEKETSTPFFGVVVVHKSVIGTPKLEALRNAYHSEPVRAFFRKRYGDAVIFLDKYNTPAVLAGEKLPRGAAPTDGVAVPKKRWASAYEKLVVLWPDLRKAFGETVLMLVITIPLAVLFGTPLGTLLFLTRPGSFIHAPRFYLVLNGLVNFVRSFPFLILLIAMIPITKAIVGTALGTAGAIVPMMVNSIPYFARFVEQNLLEVNRGVIEAAESMGATRLQIITKILYREARSGIAGSITILTVSFLSYSTVAGLVGGGGIGDFAIRYGYYRYETDIMILTIAIIIVVVQLLQFAGNAWVRKLDKRI